jgi:hypothetical protein
MTEQNIQNIETTDNETSASEVSGTPSIAQNTAISAKNTTHHPHKKHERTVGLKLLDFGLYPVLNNIAVFVVSVAATYLTTAGKSRGQGGKIGRFLNERGEKFEEIATHLGIDKKTASASKMVAFSFIDGSIMAPIVKLVEDRREPIARKLDSMLGTTPKDDSAYAAEPKQSWGSVFEGRIATLAAVLPTAIGLSHIGTIDKKWAIKPKGEAPAFESLNDKMFSIPGKKLGHHVEQNYPKLTKFFGKKTDIPMLFSIGIFEAFYTSVCTAGLYFGSRFFARKIANKHQNNGTVIHAPANASEEESPAVAAQNYKEISTYTDNTKVPHNHIGSIQQNGTLNAATSPALSA